MSIQPHNLVLAGCVILLFLACTIAGCSSTPAPSPQTTSNIRNVLITDSGFSPAIIDVKAGTTVNWTSSSQYPHSISSNFAGDNFNSPTINTGGSYQHTYTQQGRYTYFDGLNHQNTGIVNVI